MFEQFVLRTSQVIQKLEEYLLAWGILGIAALTILNVVSRTGFGHSLAFAEEVSEFLIVVVCFVGLSYAASQGRHIRMTALYDQLSDARRKTMMLVITGFTALLMFVLGVYASRYVASVYQLGGVFPTLRIPFYLVYLFAPLGLFLAGIQYVLAFIRNLTAPEIYVSFEHSEKRETPVKHEI